MPSANQQRLPSWVFGGITFLFLLGVFVLAPDELPEFKHRLLGFFAAVCAAFLGYFLTGTLGIDGNTTLKPVGKFRIKAGGGLALFVLVLLWWNSDASPSKVKKMEKKLDEIGKGVDSTNARLDQLEALYRSGLSNKTPDGNVAPFPPELVARASELLERGNLKQKAIAAIVLKRHKEAAAMLDSLGNDPLAEAFAILTLKGDNWYSANQYDEAIAPYAQALALQPDNPQALVNLGVAHTFARQGDKSAHIRTALSLFERVLGHYPKETSPVEWARTQNLLAVAWSDLPTGDHSENLQKAIAGYEAALSVRTKEAFPTEWANTQNHLAIAWRALPTGDRTANLQKAIAGYEAALSVWKKEGFPANWAQAKNNLATAWSELPTGDPTENLQAAIAGYETALSVYTKENHPAEWASTQHNLATAWRELPAGDRRANLQKAIDAYQTALSVQTKEALPADWAMTTYNLSLAYASLAELPGQPRADLLRKAANLQRDCLTVWTAAAYPEDHDDAVSALARYEADLKSATPSVVANSKE